MDETHGSTDCELHQETGLTKLDELYKRYRQVEHVATWGGSFEREHGARGELKGIVNKMFDTLLKVMEDRAKRVPQTPSPKKHEGVGEKTKTESWDKQAGAAQEDAEWAKEAARELESELDVGMFYSGEWIEAQSRFEDADTDRIAEILAPFFNSATASLRARNEELERKVKEFGGTQSRG